MSSESTRKTLKTIQAATDQLDEILASDTEFTKRQHRRKRVAGIRTKMLKITFGTLAILIILPPFYLPLQGIQTSGYFLRVQPETRFLADIEMHKGIDIAVPAGTKIGPTAIGKVKIVGESPTWGIFAIIDHGLGITSVYAHMSGISVREGDWVLPGLSVIGKAGRTGRATGNHLHFEIRLGTFSTPPGIFLVFHSIRRMIFKL